MSTSLGTHQHNPTSRNGRPRGRGSSRNGASARRFTPRRRPKVFKSPIDEDDCDGVDGENRDHERVTNSSHEDSLHNRGTTTPHRYVTPLQTFSNTFSEYLSTSTKTPSHKHQLTPMVQILIEIDSSVVIVHSEGHQEYTTLCRKVKAGRLLSLHAELRSMSAVVDVLEQVVEHRRPPPSTQHSTPQPSQERKRHTQSLSERDREAFPDREEDMKPSGETGKWCFWRRVRRKRRVRLGTSGITYCDTECMCDSMREERRRE